MKPLLAQCPYCLENSPKIAVHLISYQVVCQHCLATGPSKSSRKDAAMAWNALSDELSNSREWYANDFANRLKELEESLAPRILKTATGP